jgi:hypothetical protein
MFYSAPQQKKFENHCSRQMQVPQLGHDHFLPDPFRFISRPTIWHYDPDNESAVKELTNNRQPSHDEK